MKATWLAEERSLLTSMTKLKTSLLVMLARCASSTAATKPSSVVICASRRFTGSVSLSITRALMLFSTNRWSVLRRIFD